MKYKEKINHAEKYLSQLKQGVDEEKILNLLRSEGVAKYDINKIKTTATNLLHKEYIEKVKGYLLEETLESHIDEFDLINQETFEKIQHKAVENIKSKYDAQVSKLHRQGKSAEEIASIVNNKFYSINDVNVQIEKHQYHQEPNKNKYLWILGGVVAMTTGVFLTLRSMSSGDSSKIFHGLVLAGILMLVKGGQTQAELDGADKVKRGWFS